METMSRKGPAVVECPDDLYVRRTVQILKQNPVIEPMVMNIMQLDHIRGKFVDKPHQS